MPRAGVTPEVRALLEGARREGRRALTEPEGLAVVRSLGIRVPEHVVVADADAARAADLSRWGGDRVVVKVVSDEILHKSDVGGVDVVSREPAAVAAAVERMARRLAGRRVQGYGIYEFVPHDASLAGQLLLGARWTDDFGPVVTLGAGGIHAEFLAAQLRPGRDLAILSPVLSDEARVAASLAPVAALRLATETFRGQAPRCAPAALVDLVRRLLAFAEAAMPDLVSEFEVNPLVLSDRGPVALDALLKLGSPGRPVTSPRPVEKVARLLRPRSIAVIGVSEKMNPGRLILQNVLREGFPADRTWVVKPGRATLDGCVCVPDVASLPEPVDVLVVAVDAAQAPAVVEEVVRTGRAESLILIPGGMGERAGSEGTVDRVRSAVDRARGAPGGGPVLNGGNCLGIRSVPGRYDTLFIPKAKLSFPDVPAAPLAFVSQSGAFAIARSSQLWSLNPRYLVTCGNQIDLTVGDYLEALKGDPDLRVLAFYVEGFRPLDGRRWLAAARDATERGKAVVLYRAGRTAAGREATASHTASMAGDYAVTRALAEAAGVLVAETLAEFEDLVSLCLALERKTVAGLRVGAVSNAGFECVAMADALGPLSLATFGPETVRRLEDVLARARLESIVAAHNPLDLTPILGDEGYEDAVRAVLEEPTVDLGVVGIVPLSGAIATLPAGSGLPEDHAREGSVGPRVLRALRESPKAAVAVVDSGPLYDPLARLLEVGGVPTFRRADRALRAFARYVLWRRARGR